MQGESPTEAEAGQETSPAEESAKSSGEAPPAAPSAPAPASGSQAQPADPLAAAQAESARYKDSWLRTAADLENFRKRVRREMEESRRSGREDLLRALLPVFDNLERAIQSAARSTDIKSMADGLSMIRRQFVEALGREGIVPVPTVGHAFDPNLHEAIQQVETAEHPAGTVIAEVQPGYSQGDRLVRAAMVIVARPKPPADGGSAEKPSN